MQSKFVAVLAVAAAVVTSHAAQDLRAVMASMANGKEMRLVYVKGGNPVAFNTASNAGVYVVSSADGVIRKLYPSGTTTASVRLPNFTKDGSKVMLYNFGSGAVLLYNYTDLSLIRTVNIGSGYEAYDYWYDATSGKDYVIVCNQSRVEAINLNAPTEKVLITDKLSNINVSDGGLQISDDGKKLSLVKQTSSGERVGLLATALAGTSNGTFTPTSPGCWPQVRGGLPIMLSQNDANHGSLPNHWGPQLFNENGTKAQFIATSDTIKKHARQISGCSNGEVAYATDGHRWTRDPDYFSFYCNGSAWNPILWRMSDKKWIYIEEITSCTFVGDMDMVLVTGSEVQNPAARVQSISTKSGASGSAYSITGRRITARDGLVRGIVVKKSGGISRQAVRLTVNE